MVIKVLALDIYGTVLATKDPENKLGPRKGFGKLVEKCKQREIIIVGASDASPISVRNDLEESGVDLDIFLEFYELTQDPKDFSFILNDYSLNPQELLVIGDSDKDFQGAIRCGCRGIKIPEYVGIGKGDCFDLGELGF